MSCGQVPYFYKCTITRFFFANSFQPKKSFQMVIPTNKNNSLDKISEMKNIFRYKLKNTLCNVMKETKS